MTEGLQHGSRRNRLAAETSPYLLQHAGNPVDWYPWGPEALSRARLLDRPIFLSIGYAACHWCHVMERESFEDEATAALLNAHFIAIKVDREERPDLDSLYMGAVQAVSGQGGWPMSVFLTPDGRPFFGGTYYPDTPRHGMPSFRQVLGAIRDAWLGERDEIERIGTRVAESLASAQAGGVSAGGASAGGASAGGASAGGASAGGASAAPLAGLPGTEVLRDATRALDAAFDVANGGWGGAPKFPQPMAIEYLLGRYVATGDPHPLAVARKALVMMAAGGIRDQLGGGFHRYATDAAWLVPHFEQMLYDNAQLARAYAHAWALTGDDALLDVATGVLDYLLRELRTADGGFAASQDADTQGVEGATFTWTAAEIRDVVGDAWPLFAAAYGVTDAGNWEGRVILSRVAEDAGLAARFGLDPADVTRRLAAARAALVARRATRPQPARDDKVLAGWNGLAIGALADTARLLRFSGVPAHRPMADRYAAAASAAAEAVLAGLRTPDGRLRRSWRGGRAVADGVLEDHANLAEGLLALHQATCDERWYVESVALVELILARFANPAGGFFDTADDAERLIVRPRDVQDNATPSGGSMTATVLLRLTALSGDPRYRAAATSALADVGPYLARHPTAFAQWLIALELAHASITEVAIVGDPTDGDVERLLAVASRGHHPFRVLAASATPGASAVPLLHGRFALRDRATAFVCVRFACRQPVHEPEALEALLVGT
jgi:hypothetical protein